MEPCPTYNHDHLAAPLGLPFCPRNSGGSVKMGGMAIRVVTTAMSTAMVFLNRSSLMFISGFSLPCEFDDDCGDGSGDDT